jgi:hypothetical protein
MRVDCGRLDRDVVIRPERGEWQPRMPERLEREELADWRAGRDAIYQPRRADGRVSPRRRRRLGRRKKTLALGASCSIKCTTDPISLYSQESSP